MKKIILLSISVLFLSFIDIQQSNPVRLIMPSNGASIHNFFPVFTWVSNIQPLTKTDIRYDLKIVEVLPHQNPYFAIKSNPALYSQNALQVTNYMYPVSATGLQTGKTYAWQITTHQFKNKPTEFTSPIQEKNPISESEVYTFTITMATDSTKSKEPLSDTLQSTKEELEKNYKNLDINSHH